MALAALIIAEDEEEAGVAILGRSAIELQMGRALAAGARHLIVRARAIGPALLAAADRFRADGARVDLVRDLTGVDLPADTHLLVMRANRFLSPLRLDALASAKGSVLVCAPRGEGGGEEIIDAAYVATGHARIDAATLAETLAAIPPDWDLVSSLTRMLVQVDATRLVVAPADVTPIDAAHADAIGAALLRADATSPRGAGGRYVVRPAGQMLAHVAGAAGASDAALAAVAVAIGAVSLIATWSGYPIAALVTGVMAQIVVAGAAAIARALGAGAARWRARVAAAVTYAAIGGAAVTAWQASGQWGYLVLGVTTLGAIGAIDRWRRVPHPPLPDAPAIAIGSAFLLAIAPPVVAAIAAAVAGAAALGWFVRELARP